MSIFHLRLSKPRCSVQMFRDSTERRLFYTGSSIDQDREILTLETGKGRKLDVLDEISVCFIRAPGSTIENCKLVFLHSENYSSRHASLDAALPADVFSLLESANARAAGIQVTFSDDPQSTSLRIGDGPSTEIIWDVAASRIVRALELTIEISG